MLTHLGLAFTIVTLSTADTNWNALTFVGVKVSRAFLLF